jgi:hypothetical protein
MSHHSEDYKEVAVKHYLVFGGPTNKLIKFADLMKSKCVEIIYERKTLMWEVNVWYLVYLENPELFDSYFCNHDITIISNY